MKLRLLLILILAATLLASSEPCPEPVGAKQVKIPISDYPGVGEVFIGDSRCTGFLVASDLVMTASHCISDRSGALEDSFFLIGGNVHRLTHGVSFLGEPFVSHDVASQTDMAVLVLGEPVKDIRPLKLSTRIPQEGTMLAMIGYGCRSFCPSTDKYEYSRQGDNHKRIQFSRDLKLRYWAVFDLYACPGDSGAPVVNTITGEVVGVVSNVMYADVEGTPRFEGTALGNVVAFARMIKRSTYKDMFNK